MESSKCGRVGDIEHGQHGPFFAAAGNLPAVAMLLMFGAEVGVKNEEGKTASDFAKEGGHTLLAERLCLSDRGQWEK